MSARNPFELNSLRENAEVEAVMRKAEVEQAIASFDEAYRKWDRRFLGLANFVAGWSKDPSTQVGAVVVQDRRIISLGYNGLPQGVTDNSWRLNDRETKYKMTVHAECNAILFANRDLRGCTIYTVPFMPCARCAGFIIQSGLYRVVSVDYKGPRAEAWKPEFDVATEMFREAQVNLVLLPEEK